MLRTSTSRCFVAHAENGQTFGELSPDFLPPVGASIQLSDRSNFRQGEYSSFQSYVIRGIQVTALYAPTTREEAMSARDVSGLGSVFTLFVEPA